MQVTRARTRQLLQAKCIFYRSSDRLCGDTVRGNMAHALAGFRPKRQAQRIRAKRTALPPARSVANPTQQPMARLDVPGPWLTHDAASFLGNQLWPRFGGL